MQIMSLFLFGETHTHKQTCYRPQAYCMGHQHNIKKTNNKMAYIESYKYTWTHQWCHVCWSSLIYPERTGLLSSSHRPVFSYLPSSFLQRSFYLSFSMLGWAFKAAGPMTGPPLTSPPPATSHQTWAAAHNATLFPPAKHKQDLLLSSVIKQRPPSHIHKHTHTRTTTPSPLFFLSCTVSPVQLFTYN